LVVVIPAKRSLLIVLFLGAWLVAWCLGEVFAVRQLLVGTDDASALFLIFWLMMWTAGGAMALRVWLWNAFGKEVVTVRPSGLVLKRDYLGLGFSQEYELAQVKRLRVVERAANQLGSVYPIGSWAVGPGRVAFDYGASTVHFAAGIDESEAAMIVSDLRARHVFGED